MLVRLWDNDVLQVLHGEAEEEELKLIHLCNVRPWNADPFPLLPHMAIRSPRTKFWPHPRPRWKGADGAGILLDRLVVVVDSEPLLSELVNLLARKKPSSQMPKFESHCRSISNNGLIHHLRDRHRQLIVEWCLPLCHHSKIL